ncbi:MAG: MarR family transcriptional regulator [Pirellulales bacterium]|nr:MarR family transcriptional regulator [Pirellulales bacterium]
MLDYDFDESPGYWLIMAAEAYQRAVNEELAPHGITFRQCQVLGYLSLEGTLSQCELADRMRIEPPTLVGILDRMERDGWIRREPCPDDRRRKRIHPLPEAEPVWAKIIACGQQVRARSVDGLSDAERQQLKSLLTRVRKNLTAYEPAEEVATS